MMTTFSIGTRKIIRRDASCKFAWIEIAVCPVCGFTGGQMKLSRQIFIAAFFFVNAQMICHAQSGATNLWTLHLANYDCDSSPALAQDGTIYQATFDGKLLAVTPQGEIKWVFTTGAEIFGRR
jgi:outer membrane protein assembly factor BamB